MNTYFSTFIPGLGEVVVSALKEYLSGVEIVLLLDGLVVYKTDLPTEKVVELPRLPSSVRTFRIIISFENELGQIDPNLLKNMEEKLARATSLTLDRGKPDLEFWFLERTEGVGFFALRLTRKASGEKFLKPGELRPELANLLCLLAEPKEGDVFLDPFAGWGGIVKESLRLESKSTKILASD